MICCKYHLVVDGKDKEYMLVAKIIAVKEVEGRKGLYEHRAKYANIDTYEREEIIRFIFEEERKNRKREKGLYNFLRAIASIELTERYCIHFINIVNSIDRAADSAELYSILADARAAELDADKSYSGVADASAKLAKAISDFNAQVNSINADYEEANTVAANTCGVGGVADNTVAGQVIALIKKFFDEE